MKQTAEYSREVQLGQKLVAEGVIPDLQHDPYFRNGFARNMVRIRDHLERWQERTDFFHPEHHLFVGHAILQTGYIIFGYQFPDITVEHVQVPGHRAPIDVNLGEMANAYKWLLHFYAQDIKGMRGSYNIYQDLVQKATLSEQVGIIERHIEKIPTNHQNLRSLEEVMFDMAVQTEDGSAKAGGRHYSLEEVKHTYLLGALIKRVHAAEKLRQRGLTNIGASAKESHHATNKMKKKKS